MSLNPITTIHVTYNEEAGTLTLDQPQINLAAGAAIQWVFSSNTPVHALPHAFFQPVGIPDEHFKEEAEQFGPFQYLEPGPRTLIAFGNTGKQINYPYTLLLLNEDGPLATSAAVQTSIDNQSDIEDTSPDALITYHADAEPHLRLRVSPSPLRVQPGRTAIWYIKGIPTGHFVSFRFPASQDPLTGPFLSFSLSRGFGNAWLANGAGIQFPEGQNPSITYLVTVRNALGTVVAVDDPTIEPLGPPPNTGTGG